MSTWKFGQASSCAPTQSRSSALQPTWAPMKVVAGWAAQESGELVHQLDEGGEVGVVEGAGRASRVEMPIGVAMELFPALVEAVERLEEGDGIGDADHHRQTQFGGGGPEGVEARVVDGHQATVRVAHAQPERFPDLQAARPDRRRLAQAARLGLAESAIDGDVGVVDTSEDGEALGVGILVAGDLGPEHVAPLAVEIDDRLHAGLVHRLDQLGDRAARPVAGEVAEGAAEVVVGVDHREARRRRCPVGRPGGGAGQEGRERQVWAGEQCPYS